MDTLDGVLLAVLLMSCLLGLWRGVIRETMALAAWLLGFVLSSKYAADMAVHLPPDWGDPLRYLAAWLLVFGAVWLSMSILSALTQRLPKYFTNAASQQKYRILHKIPETYSMGNIN